MPPPPSKIGPDWVRKVLKAVLESSQKIIGGFIYSKCKKAFCQMLCSIQISNAFDTIRNLRLLFSNANSEAG